MVKVRNGVPPFTYFANGAPIGRASRAIAPGDHVHLHNLVSNYTPTYALNKGDA